MAPTTRLTARLITEADTDELTKMRLACGWGADLVPLYLKRTLELENMYMFLFYLPSSAPSEPPTPVAMGALETVDVMYGDLALADPNPAVRRVLISRLFVYKWYEGGGVGGEVMDFLEAEARRRGAKTLTINCPPFEEDGTEGRLKEWYKRRGYREFREHRPWYIDPTDSSRPKIVACFLEKAAGSAEADRRLVAT